LSLLVEELAAVSPTSFGRVTLDSVAGASNGPIEDFEGFFHFRCKTGDATETIEIMQTLDRRLRR
jgi:hypothetical protein